jgi:hypothetical protein
MRLALSGILLRSGIAGLADMAQLIALQRSFELITFLPFSTFPPFR